MVITLNFGKFCRQACLVSVIACGVFRASAQELSAPPASAEVATQNPSENPTSATPDKPSSAQPAISELEQLLSRPVEVPALAQVVNTVSRQESTVGKSPAAVFVITNDMIRRNGATSIPEALRMAPGLNVARIDSNKWAVSVRGFNDRFASKLLVQVDGRVVYNQLTGGVYWDVPDVVLQDVERIEVIRGPGATVWGSNAVNGIINIITKSSKDTQGILVATGGGSEDRGIASVRYGGHLEDDLHYRVYAKWTERDRSFLPSGGSQLPPPPSGVPFTQANDDWRVGRGGFRVDWNATSEDTVQLQGDAFAVSSGRSDFRPQAATPFVFQNVEDELSIGGNLLTRWRHEIAPDSNWTLQLYWDHFGRQSSNNNNVNAININHPVNVSQLDFRADTYDLDFQHQFPLGNRNKFIYGAGYRIVDTYFSGSVGDGGFDLTSTPNSRILNRYAAFLQDEYTVVDDRLFFTAGSKFEHNTFAGFQYQPSGRLLWTPTNRQSAWAAVSRAVRVPNIGENAVSITGFTPTSGVLVRTNGSKNLDAEDVMAYELGYRAQPVDEFSFDTTVFYNVYNNLIGTQAAGVTGGPPTIVNVGRANVLNAETYGFELSANWKLSDAWRLQSTYSFLQIQAHRAAGINPSSERAVEGQSPQNQVYLQSSWDLTKEWEFDLIGRYVDRLSNFPSAAPNGVPSYISMDARVGWKPNSNWELSVVGQNLLDSHHLEFGGNQFLSAPLIEMQRGVYAMAVWRR